MKTIVAALAALSTSMSFAIAGDHDMISHAGLDEVLTLAKGYGRADIVEIEGRSRIEGRMEGILYSIDVDDCDDARKKCTTLIMSAWWDQEGADVDYEALNAFNAGTKYGRGYADPDNDIWVEMGVNLKAGVSKSNLDDSLDWFRVIVVEFNNTVVIGDE